MSTVLEQVVETSTKKRPGTRAQYLRAIRAFLDFAGRDQGRWTGAAVEAFRDHLVLQRRLSAPTVNAKLSAIKFASKRLEALDLGRDFARAAEFLPVTREKKRRAPRFEVGQQLVAACEGTPPLALRDRALIVLALRTGMRRESLAELLIEDVEPSLTACTVIVKGGRRHRVTFDRAEAGAALTAWLDWLAASPRTITSGHVFRSLRREVGAWYVGERLHASSVNLIFTRRAERAGIGHFFPHLARHAFVSWAEGHGVSRPRIAAVTGHRSLDALWPYLDDLAADDDPVSRQLPPLVRGQLTESRCAARVSSPRCLVNAATSQNLNRMSNDSGRQS